MLSYEIFGAISPSLAIDVLDFTHQSDKKLYRAALEAVAAHRKLRPVFLERMSRAERNPLMLGSLKREELSLITDNLIRHWLLGKHADMLSAFLTNLGIPNKQGAVEELPDSVGEAPLRSSINTLLAQYPAEVVAVYLNAFNQFNGAVWENLDQLLKSDPRLGLPVALAP
ncbi:MAG: hypothetical protein HYR88_09900 [Verrucomicrobia bacterium]|nr:hypothetical protein [Verrucomicrobiota bacterium]MBI3867112.1 hypothetical protein [Verrucomicrobiota bacterium]